MNATQRTSDGYRIVTGMSVWSNDLRVVVVTDPSPYNEGWWNTSYPNGSRGPLLNGERMAVYNPFTHEAASTAHEEEH